jgi:hypothetical protein
VAARFAAGTGREHGRVANRLATAGAAACTVYCPDGQFGATRNGSATCVPCPAGSRCSGGYKSACSAGSFQNEVGQAECISCEDGEFADPSSNTCRLCPRTSSDEEAVCKKGGLTLRHGFISSAALKSGARGSQEVSNTTVFTACPCGEACCHVSFFSARNSTTAVECRHHTHGTLCALCETGYYHQFAGDPCNRCPSSGFAGFLKQQTALFVALGVIIGLACADAFSGWRVRRWLRERVPRVWARIVSKTKILVNFMQLVTLFGPVYRIRFPSVFAGFLRTFSFASLDVFRWLPLDCYFHGFNFYDELTTSTVFFLGLAVAAFAVNVIKGWTGIPRSISRAADSFTR